MDSPDPKLTLTQLRDALLTLHKELLDSERASYERDVARIESPSHFLNLLMEDPWFTWLREISGLVVEIDVCVDDKKEPATSRHADAFLRRSRNMLVPAEDGQGFGKRYWEAFQRDPAVVIAHSAVMRVISGLKA